MRCDLCGNEDADFICDECEGCELCCECDDEEDGE